jgi:hypothetical protein
MKIEIEIKLSQKEVEESRSYQKKQDNHNAKRRYRRSNVFRRVQGKYLNRSNQSINKK